jgi:hypothetical protein
MTEELKTWYEERNKPWAGEISNEVVRVYHAERNEVLDKASGLRRSYKDVVIGGNIGDMVEARRKEIGEGE